MTQERIHVVVVEDDMDLGFLFMNLLPRRQGFEAVHIATAEGAMHESIWDPDGGQIVGVIDLMLPTHSGIEVARWVRENVTRSVPLLGVTAADRDSTIFKDAVKSGCFDDVQEKPVQPTALVTVLRTLACGETF